MATLDETNIFGLTPNQPEKKDDSLSRLGISESGYLNRLAQIQNMQFAEQKGVAEVRSARGAEKKALRDQYLADLSEAVKDPTQEKRDTALESFFETPFMFQMGQYIPDPTGLPTDIAEAEYSGRKFKESREARGKCTEFYPGPLGMSDRPYYPDMTPEEAGLKLQQGLDIGSIPPGIGGIAGIAQSMVGLPSKVLRSKTMDGQGGGSGGISEIPPEPKKDYAGFVSSVEKVALGPQKFGSGQDLINFIESPKRSGISKKELEYIDFDQIRNNPDLTKEDVVKYIQDNRPNIYRVQRSEDNPTYRADESDNPLTFLPLNEEATRIANAEEQAFFRDEYAREITDHNAILTNNSTLQNSNFVLNSENINDPSVLDDVERYLKFEPEAYINTNPVVVKYTKPDGTTGTGAFETFTSDDFPEKFDQLIELAEDGATIEFPALTTKPDDIIELASSQRVSPDYGNQIEVYEEVGNSGTKYKIIGTEDSGYQVSIDDEFVTRRGGSFEPEFYDDLADARVRVQDEAFNLGDITEGADTFDTGSNPDQLLDSAPYDVITGEATLPTRFGYQYEDFRLPMGGANNYREFTLHIANPKTATRYDSNKGTKHFGGGDELLHYRTTDRIDEDGKKVLFVEEIQSDLNSTASSTKSNATYELSPKEKEKIYDELEKFGFETNRMAGLIAEDQNYVGELRFKGSTGSLVPVPPSGVRALGVALRKYGDDASLTAVPMLSKTQAEELVKKFGKDKIIEMADIIEPMRKAGELPDYPYKGNDYIELAVKDIMKLASEGDYDRVAFTNPATQLRRNRKDLAYIDSIEINQVPKLTEAEQQFNENWMRTRDRSMVSTMSPDSNVTETISGKNTMRFDGPLGNADLNSFVGTHTDFVVNDPQANKLWQDFHKSENLEFNKNIEDYFDEYMVDNLNDLDDKILFDNDIKQTVQYVFAKADKPLTPTQVAEEVQKLLIKKAKFHHLRTLKNVLDNSASQDLNLLREYKQLKGADASSDAEVFNHLQKHALDEIEKQQGKPFGDINLENIVLPESITQKVNQNTRRAISSIMRSFYDHTLPNVEDAGRYIVKQKGTGFEVDVDQFMLEKGDMDDNLSTLKFESIEDILEGDIVEGDRRYFSLNKTLKEQIKKDVEKGNIPESTKDSQIYKIEGEMGEGKKPLDMYGKIIPQQLKKIAQKYDKNAKPQLKRVLYSYEEGIDAEQLYGDFKTEEKLRLEEAEIGGLYGRDFEEPLTHEAASIDITPEMRKAILTEGVNVMYKGGIVNKVKSMDKPIQGNRREI